MCYRIRFRRRAMDELCCARAYGETFSAALDEWVADIAADTSQRDTSRSFDVLTLFEDVLNAAANPTPWKAAWMTWCQATPLEKIQALVILLRRRCPPWELRVTSRWFRGVLGVLDCEVHAYYEVNHVKQEVVFTKFDGLPGEDQ